VAVGGQPLIQCAESGYRTGTHLANVLLIDGRGQQGDNGYTMGVPMATWHGQRIQRCHAAPDGETGTARLNLAPAYPAELGVLTYTRDFTFSPTAVQVRDTVITAAPHRFSYCFHTWRRHQLTPQPDGAWRFAWDDAALVLRVTGTGWTTAVAPTEVVWAYANEQDSQPFQHLAVSHPEPLTAFVVDFTIALP
jgi:hypothetical protein